MIIDLMPYRLHSNYKDLANLLSYIDSYNGVKLYKVNHPEPLLPDIQLTDAHLYFLSEKLITVYLHLVNNLDHIEILVKALTLQLGLKSVLTKSQFGLKYRWEIEDHVLVLVKDQIHRKFFIYYALKKFNVF